VAAVPAGGANLQPELLLAANRQAVRARVGRWLIHDLRNPTQALTLVSGVLEDPQDAGELPLIQTLQDATAHLGRTLALLDRLLSVTPTGTAPAPLVLHDTLRFVSALCEVSHTGVTLDLAGTENLPAVRAVEADLELVLLNLVTNSLEALRGQPSGRITMAASRAGAEVQVSVTDDGPGPAPGIEARMFEPFVTGWTVGDFTGIGLTVSRAIAERDGGRLTYEPGAQPGARFVLSLPIVQ
jgi:C4-dicarboxylate-specific signal transduction histidine kinase